MRPLDQILGDASPPLPDVMEGGKVPYYKTCGKCFLDKNIFYLLKILGGAPPGPHGHDATDTDTFFVDSISVCLFLSVLIFFYLTC